MSFKVAKSPKVNLKTETEIAVLQVRVNNVEEKFNDIKEDLKQVTASIEKNSEETQKMLNDIKKSADEAHNKLERKISSLEKWRWMLVGAGIVLGSMGFKTISSLFQL